MKDQESRDWLLLASLLLNRHEPMSPHHVGAVRERLGYASDNELTEALRTGRVPPNAQIQAPAPRSRGGRVESVVGRPLPEDEA